VSQWITLADGRRLVYHRRGRGPLVVCHPGGPGIGAAYFSDLAGLAEDLEVLVVQPRGTGGSSRPASPEAYDLEDYVADLDELRDQLRLGPMRLLGHSHGGFVAQVYAGTHPEAVTRLVLANTAARVSGDAVETAMEAALARHSGRPWYADARQALDDETAGRYADDAALGELLRREMPLYFSRYGEPAAAYVASLAEEPPNGDALRVSNRALPLFDLRPLLARIRCPTLVLTGAEDFITSTAAAKELGERIAGARVEVIAGCGHWSFVEQPVQFRRLVGDFLRG
jgi:proline iminopeptidase